MNLNDPQKGRLIGLARIMFGEQCVALVDFSVAHETAAAYQSGAMVFAIDQNIGRELNSDNPNGLRIDAMTELLATIKANPYRVEPVYQHPTANRYMFPGEVLHA